MVTSSDQPVVQAHSFADWAYLNKPEKLAATAISASIIIVHRSHLSSHPSSTCLFTSSHHCFVPTESTASVRFSDSTRYPSNNNTLRQFYTTYSAYSFHDSTIFVPFLYLIVFLTTTWSHHHNNTCFDIILQEWEFRHTKEQNPRGFPWL